MVDALPYTQERIDGLLSLIKTDIGDLNIPSAPPPVDDKKADNGAEFKQFDPASQQST